ncbi:hypothetical protein [Archaeoglobus veneficus]|uniref:Uncharacterized protein n=1 Tax=Archaeoglobus veneficus (strain DSM 11195 / SNP6) TaxID=693661 RepID=F2KT00_ARCVS|nr:hypothetical protein [Archaeoglobus veneficus]AEA47030.1 hypothetical protein Arcve_1019 [Archaeoglobus veneficus SNP6]
MADNGEKYFMVILPRTQAVVIVNMKSKVVDVTDCTNRDFCTSYNIAKYGVCPQYCKVIVDVKNKLFRGLEAKAELRELENPPDQIVEAF